MAEPEDPNQDNVDDAWADAFAEQAAAEDGAISEIEKSASGYESTQLTELEADDKKSDESVDLEMVLDIPVTISMEIGRTQISIRNLLKLNQGSVVELDRLAGEPLDVLVNGTLIAHGEVVVVNEKFGIRLTDVITAMERIKKLT